MSEITAQPPLVGLRVLDLASYFAGPGAAMFLADYGADVVKVELPAGDPGRSAPPRVQGTDISKAFLVSNRGKRSAVIDWRLPAGQQVTDRLLQRADAVILDRPVGAGASDWPFHYRRLHALNPRLIHASSTPFDRNGQYAEFPAYEPLVQAASGVMGASRTRAGRPVHAGFRLGESATAMLLAYGVMMALLTRMRSGQGLRVETSMLQAAIAMQSVQLVWADDDPTPPSDPAQATVASYQCADRRYINIITIQERQWQAMCRVLELDHLIGDPSYSSGTARTQRRVELFPLLEGIFGTRPSEEWLRLLQEADVPCGPTLSRLELFDDPQIVENGVSAAITHPTLGLVQMLGSPISFSETPVQVGRSVPELGEHTRQVLTEAGFPTTEIDALVADRVIR